MVWRGAVLIAAAAVAVCNAYDTAKAETLDYGFYKANVQPIFLKKRVGHTRCIVCHAGANNAMRLTPLERGASDFTDEQSKTNFETVSQIVTPGNPMEINCLVHPLYPHFGGS